MNKLITKTKHDIFYISLNNPEKRNALDLELITELTSTFKELRSSLSTLKALVLLGEGKSFCAGADLNWMKEMINYSFNENINDSYKLYNLFYEIYSFPLPVIVKAHGHVLGGGLGLLAVADYVLAEESTKFCFSEVKLGLAPAIISSFILSKCNSSHAQALMTSGIMFNTSKAFHLGLVNSTLTNESFNKVLESYKASGQEGLIKSKNLCLFQRSLKPEDFKELTVKTIASLRVNSDAQKKMIFFLKGIK